MVKYTQNKISGSSWALPFTSIYASIIWILSGGIKEKWWLQLACLAVTTYLMVQLNNKNMLIRIYSRMVSCVFLILSCCACFLFPSLEGEITSLFFVLSYLFLFASYQDETSVGKLYYAFLCLGIASFGHIQILYFIPILLILTGVYLSSISWRTLLASLLGLITPYWFSLCWYLFQKDTDGLMSHFEQLYIFHPPFDFSCLSPGQTITFCFILVLFFIGSFHILRKSYADNIRTRMFYNLFIWTDVISAVFIIIQPQQYNFLIRLMIINTSPLIAHFLALTSTKITNIIFHILAVISIILTVYNLWTTSYLF